MCAGAGARGVCVCMCASTHAHTRKRKGEIEGGKIMIERPKSKVQEMGPVTCIPNPNEEQVIDDREVVGCPTWPCFPGQAVGGLGRE